LALRQRIVNRRDDALVGQHLIGVLHPSLAQIAYLFSDQSVAEAQLRAAHLNHADASRVCGTVPAAEARD
jgi:hypothetical protein